MHLDDSLLLLTVQGVPSKHDTHLVLGMHRLPMHGSGRSRCERGRLSWQAALGRMQQLAKLATLAR